MLVCEVLGIFVVALQMQMLKHFHKVFLDLLCNNFESCQKLHLQSDCSFSSPQKAAMSRVLDKLKSKRASKGIRFHLEVLIQHFHEFLEGRRKLTFLERQRKTQVLITARYSELSKQLQLSEEVTLSVYMDLWILSFNASVLSLLVLVYAASEPLSE